MDLTNILSKDIQNWHDYNSFHLPNLTAQGELIDMSHYHERSTSTFLLLYGWRCARAACAEVSTVSMKARLGFTSHMAPQRPCGTRSI
jgi:hypothetical protein